jgi:hypothetical protein
MPSSPCPDCGGELNPVAYPVAYSGDGDYYYESGFVCDQCRHTFDENLASYSTDRLKSPPLPR